MAKSIGINGLTSGRDPDPVQIAFAQRADASRPGTPGFGDGRLDRAETRATMNSIRVELKDRLQLNDLPSDHLLVRGTLGSAQGLPANAVEHRFGPEERALVKELWAGEEFDRDLAPLSEKIGRAFGEFKSWMRSMNPFYR